MVEKKYILCLAEVPGHLCNFCLAFGVKMSKRFEACPDFQKANQKVKLTVPRYLWPLSCLVINGDFLVGEVSLGLKRFSRDKLQPLATDDEDYRHWPLAYHSVSQAIYRTSIDPDWADTTVQYHVSVMYTRIGFQVSFTIQTMAKNYNTKTRSSWLSRGLCASGYAHRQPIKVQYENETTF